MEKSVLKIITNPNDQISNLKDFEAEDRLVTIPSVSLPAESTNPLSVPSIKSHTDDEIFSVILMSLAKSYTDLGRDQLSDKDKSYIANSLADSIPRKFPSIRLHEIPLAFADGIRGKYGEYYGLNIVSFENFIEARLSHESREQFAKLLPVKTETKEPDTETKFQTAGFNAVKALREYAAGKDISLSALIVYEFLNDIKLIQFTNEEKWDFVEAAAELLASDLVKQLTECKSSTQRVKIRKQLESVRDRTAVELIKNTAKRLTLNSFFKTCLLKKIDLVSLIKGQRHYFQ